MKVIVLNILYNIIFLIVFTLKLKELAEISVNQDKFK